MLRESTVKRFKSRVDTSGGPGACWPWKGRIAANGYGVMDVTELKRAPSYAHRLAISIHRGSMVGHGDFVCHRCDNPPCCNPAHLFVGDHGDNMRDCASKGRLASQAGRSLRGERHHAAKLTVDDVHLIDRMDASGCTRREIAEKFGVTRALIGMIVKRKVWRHVPRREAA